MVGLNIEFGSSFAIFYYLLLMRNLAIIVMGGGGTLIRIRSAFVIT